jgi:hypothetical protein
MTKSAIALLLAALASTAVPADTAAKPQTEETGTTKKAQESLTTVPMEDFLSQLRGYYGEDTNRCSTSTISTI